MDIQYPVRCRIIDVTGHHGASDGTVISLRTPEVSKPHIGKEGLAELDGSGIGVMITLDDGTVLPGSHCWWEPLGARESEE